MLRDKLDPDRSFISPGQECPPACMPSSNLYSTRAGWCCCQNLWRCDSVGTESNTRICIRSRPPASTVRACEEVIWSVQRVILESVFDPGPLLLLSELVKRWFGRYRVILESIFDPGLLLLLSELVNRWSSLCWTQAACWCCQSLRRKRVN